MPVDRPIPVRGEWAINPDSRFPGFQEAGMRESGRRKDRFMSKRKRTVTKSKHSHPPAGPIDWKLPGLPFEDFERVFHGVLLCLKKMGRRRWPAWEKSVVEYACWDVRGSLPGLEYAKEIVRGRWPEIEPDLIDEMHHLAEYLEWRGFAVGTGPLESLILGGKRYHIAKRAHAACLYAQIVLKDRWEEGERVILEAASEAYREAEAPRVAEAYRKRFFPRRVWPALQEQIREGRCSPGFVVEYSRITGKKCHDDANEGLLKADRNAEGFTELLWDYASGVIDRKLPEDLDTFMLMKSFEDDPFVTRYVRAY